VLGASLVLASCSWKAQQQPSVLVIFVENLSFSSVSCSERVSVEPSLSGLQSLCNESLRFTHAYAPSTLSQATLASVLTARYPQDHGVRHNGAQFISAKLNTVGEVARQRGYRTSFFSGGAPIWRKSGLNQGFEVFDDTFAPSLKSSYRPMGEIFRAFLNWRDIESAHSHFFSMLYLPDLQFIDAATVNELGEARVSSFKGQVEELDGSLGQLFAQMKQKKIWDNTYIFLVGLNGNYSDLRSSEAYPLDLYSENTRVTLLMKPAFRNRESPMSWKIDTNVSLVDVGSTLYDFLGEPLPSLERSGLSSVSLLPLLQLHDGLHQQVTEKTFLPNSDRWIMSESDWMGQQGLSGGIRFAIRKGELLFIYDEHRRLYNTLTDNFELNRLPEDDPLYIQESGEFEKYFRKQGLASWVSLSPPLFNKIYLGHEVWRQRSIPSETLSQLRDLSIQNPADPQLRGWRALLALRHEDWKELKAAATAVHGNEIWRYVAEVNMNLPQANLPKNDICFIYGVELLRGQSESTAARECSTPELLALYDWLRSGNSVLKRQKNLEVFIKKAMPHWLESRIAEENYATGAVWDVSLEKPRAPSTPELILALPEAKKFRLALKERLKI
jgi:hypothetical protein